MIQLELSLISAIHNVSEIFRYWYLLYALDPKLFLGAFWRYGATETAAFTMTESFLSTFSYCFSKLWQQRDCLHFAGSRIASIAGWPLPEPEYVHGSIRSASSLVIRPTHLSRMLTWPTAAEDVKELLQSSPYHVGALILAPAHISSAVVAPCLADLVVSTSPANWLAFAYALLSLAYWQSFCKLHLSRSMSGLIGDSFMFAWSC